MLAPTSFALTCPATKMKALHLSPASASSPSFALISVLALVSLAALTATAFLASARLERQATMPLTQTTILEMALDAGAECAKEVVDAPLNHFNHVTTYWRGANPSDWTNELGYLLNGSARKTRANDRTSTIIVYASCFSSATFTNLGTNASELIVMTNDISSQGSFFSEMSTKMFNQTNFAAGQSTNIPLLGDTPANRFTSPPVGWVYIKQDVRVKPGLTNTTNVPVARFAFYVQDLSSMIDAERMGGFTNGTPYRASTALPVNYVQGTNPAEISLTNLTGTALTNATTASNFTSTNNRIKYLTPGMLVLSNGGGLNTNDLRYVTAGLLHWTNAFRRIPMGLGYSLSWSTNFLLDNSTINTTPGATLMSSITNWISTNLPGFTNRAGGMNGTNYLAALAANIIDYADTNANPTVNGATVGYDNYPLPVVFSDRIALNGANPLTNTNNLAAATITVTTYVQLWNCSTLTSPAVTYSLVNNFQDVLLRSNGSSFPNNQIFTNRPLTNPLVVPALPPNAVVILAVTNSTTVGPRAGIPGGLAVQTNTLTINHINGNSYTNFADLFELSLGGKIISQHKGSYTRIGQKITNGSWDWEGTALLMSRTNNPNLAPIGDPRMLRFQSNPAAIPLAYRSSMSGSLRWGGYPYYEPQGGVWNGHPDNWPDGRKSTAASPTGTGQTGGAGGSLPVAVGTPTNLPGTAPAILTTNGKFLTVTELGNVFDPIQWKPPTGFSNNTKYAGCSIDTTWTNTGGELHGGGNTLRIGRPEHSLFAFTNVAGSTVATPNMQMSAAALLDLFCTTTQFDESGKINLNTAPAPVLRALAGGIYLRSDPALSPGGTNFSVPPEMAEAFAQGVMRFRAKYPFHSPSQLAFIGTDQTWPNTNTWPKNAVFGNTNTISLVTNSVNSLTSTSLGITEWNDQAAEEWFSKIFDLSTTYSRNFRVYVIAQKATNQGGTNIGVGPVVRKYYNIITRCNDDRVTDTPGVGFSTRPTLEAPY